MRETHHRQWDHSGAARRPEHAPLATRKNAALSLSCVCVCVCARARVRVCTHVTCRRKDVTANDVLVRSWNKRCVTNGISFHARVGCFSPFCIRWSVAITVISFWLHLVVLDSPCFLCPRISCEYRFPRTPLFPYSERKLWKVRIGSSKLQFGDRQTRVKTVHYCSDDRNSRCDAT